MAMPHFTAMMETCSTIGAWPVALRLRSTGGRGATVVRAGGALEKYFPYTPFILVNSLRSSTYTLLETTFEKSSPASSRPSSRLRIVWRTWFSTSSAKMPPFGPGMKPDLAEQKKVSSANTQGLAVGLGGIFLGLRARRFERSRMATPVNSMFAPLGRLATWIVALAGG